MKVNKKNEEVITFEVHWYGTYTHSFNVVYKTKMVVEKYITR